MIRAYYNIFFVIFSGVGILFLPNIIFGIFSTDRFFKYAVFYLAIFLLALFCFTRFKFSIRDNRHWLAFLTFISFPFLLDLMFYRLYFDAYDALKGALYLISWSSMALCLVWVYNNIFAETKDHFLAIKELVRPYFYICLVIVVLQIITFFLLLFGFLDLINYPIEPIFGYEFFERIERERKFYQGFDEMYVPGYLSIFSISPRTLFIEDLPIVFNGWSYEPHTSAFFVTSSVFFTGWFFRSDLIKILIYSTYLLFFLGTSSITNLLSLLFVGFVYIIVECLNKNFKPLSRSFLAVLIILIIGLFSPFIFSFIFQLLESISTLISWKLIDESGVSVTRETSQGAWLVQFFPKSFFGTGILNVPLLEEYSFADPGIIALFTNLILFSSMLILIIYSLRGDVNSRIIAYSTLYVFLHCLKFPFQYFTYPYWFYIIFLAVLNSSFQRKTKLSKH